MRVYYYFYSLYPKQSNKPLSCKGFLSVKQYEKKLVKKCGQLKNRKKRTQKIKTKNCRASYIYTNRMWTVRRIKAGAANKFSAHWLNAYTRFNQDKINMLYLVRANTDQKQILNFEPIQNYIYPNTKRPYTDQLLFSTPTR